MKKSPMDRVLALALAALERVTENEQDRHECCRFCEVESLPNNPGDENTDYSLDHDGDCPIRQCDKAISAIYRFKNRSPA